MSTQTDLQLGGEIQDHLLEPYDGGLTWPTGLWTFAQVYQALTDAMNEYLRDTGCFLTPVSIPLPASTHRATLPQNWIITADVCYRDVLGKVTEIPRSSDVEADSGQPDWEVNDAPLPLMYTDATQPTLQLQVMPAASLGGQLEVLYVAIGQTLDGSGVVVTCPECATPAVKWRAIGILLENLGRSADAEAAGYCRARYQEIVEATLAFLSGWSA